MTAQKPSYSLGEQLGAIIFIVFLASIGGMAISLLGGFKIPGIGTKFKGCEIKPLLKCIRLPPIVGMIIMGCVGRNYMVTVTKAFPNEWA